jgi:hypothetical protein
MKKHQQIFAVISVFFLMNITGAFAQKSPIYVDDVEINSIEHLEYISIVVVSKGLGSKSKVIVDYGQKINWLSLGNPKIRTSKGGDVEAFNGSVDALNLFYANGWVFVNHVEIEIGISGEIGFVFLLKRK